MNILNLKRQALGWVLRSGSDSDGGSDGGGWGSASYGRSIAGMDGARGIATGQYGNTGNGGIQPMGPDGPGFGTAADNAAALSTGAAAGGYGYGGWAAPDAATESHPDRATTGWEGAADAAEKKAKLDRPSWYNNDEKGLAERVFDATNPDPKSKLGRLGIRGFGMSFGDLQNQEAVNPGMRETRVAEGMNGITGIAKTFMPGMGLLSAGVTAANVVNDIKSGVPVGDSLTRVVPGLVDSSLNRLTQGALGKASLVAGVANEFNPSIPNVPSVGAAVWSGLGNKKPSTSIGPSMGSTVSGGDVSPSGTGYDTGGWSSGGSYKAAPVRVPETVIPESTPQDIPPVTSAPLDTRLFRKRK